jgi:hypothetical protein
VRHDLVQRIQNAVQHVVQLQRAGQHAGGLGQCLGKAALLLLGIFHALALHGIANGARQQAGIDLALHQVVLRAIVHCAHAQLLVVHAGHHQDGRARAGGMHGVQRVHAPAVRQGQVEQDGVGIALRVCAYRVGQRAVRLQHELAGLFLQHLGNQPHVARVVLHEHDVQNFTAVQITASLTVYRLPVQYPAV